MASLPAAPVPLQLRSGRQLAALVAGFLVCVALIPLQIDEAFGLPAHPLLLHVPVVFDPLLTLLTLLLVARPGLRARWGLAWAAFAVFCLLATILTVGAGEAFYDGRPMVEGVLREHKEAGETLRLLAIGLTAAILLLVAVDWRGMQRTLAIGLSVLVAVLALGTGFFTVRTGHLGAKSAWQREGGGGGPPPGFPAP